MNSIWIALLLLRRTLSSRRSLLTGIVVPAVIVLLLSFAAGRQTSTITIPVRDQDVGPLGEALINGVNKEITGIHFVSAGQHEPPWLIIPADFSDTASNGKADSLVIQGLSDSFTLALQADLTVRIDVWEERALQLRASGFTTEQIPDLLASETPSGESERFTIVRPAHEVEPWMRTTAGIAIVLMMTFVSGTVVHILDDRDRHTMLRMFASPVRSSEIAFGYVLGSLIIGSFQVLVLLVVIHFGSLGNIRSLGGIWLILECLLLAAIGLNCAVGSAAKTGRSLSGFVTIAVIPTSMLGGCFWPIEMMPAFMQKLAAFVPQTWVLDAWMRAASGADLREYANSLLLVLLFAAILLSVGASILKPDDGGSRP